MDPLLTTIISQQMQLKVSEYNKTSSQGHNTCWPADNLHERLPELG